MLGGVRGSPECLGPVNNEKPWGLAPEVVLWPPYVCCGTPHSHTHEHACTYIHIIFIHDANTYTKMKRIMAKQRLEADIWLYSFHMWKWSSVWVWMCGGYVYTRLCVWMPMNVYVYVVSMTVTDTFVCHAISYFLRSDLSLNLEFSTLAGQRAPQIPLSLPFCVRITYILSCTVFCGCWGPKFRSPCCITSSWLVEPTLSLHLPQLRFYLLFLLICHCLYLEFRGFCFALL